MSDTSGFYKLEGENWIYAKDTVHTPTGVLERSKKDKLVLPHLGWDWYDESPDVKTKFELWEERMDAMVDLKNQAKDSALEIPFTEFYEANQAAISSFIDSASSTFLDTCKTSTEKFLDLKETPESQSPREVLIAKLEPLVVAK